MYAPRPHDILLFGATGYTGRLTARELDRRGYSFALAGRDEEKLDVLSRSLSCRPRYYVADATDGEKLVQAAATSRVVLTCAGPFLRFGQGMAQAALEAGAHYIDSTAEQSFIRWVADTFHEPARKKNLSFCPAFGFDVVPGDQAAACAFGALDKNDLPQGARIFYHFEGTGFSRGTFDSMSRAVTEEGVGFEDGAYVPMEAFGHLARVDFPELGGQYAVPVPLGETVTVARHFHPQFVRNYMVLPNPLAELAVASRGLLRDLFSGTGREKVQAVINRMPEGPAPQVRRAFRYQIMAEAYGKSGRRIRAMASGRDGYGLTGESLAVYAQRLAGSEIPLKGVITPSQAAPASWLEKTLKRSPIKFDLLD